MFERDLKRLVVDRLDAEFGRILDLAGVDRLGILHRILQIGVLRGVLRVHQPAEGEDEVLRRHRLAVRPLGVVAQLEGVGQAVVGDFVALGDAQHRLGVGILGEQALVDVARDPVLPVARELLRIERGDVAAVVDDHFLRLRGAHRQEGRERQRAGECSERKAHGKSCLHKWRRWRILECACVTIRLAAVQRDTGQRLRRCGPRKVLTKRQFRLQEIASNGCSRVRGGAAVPMTQGNGRPVDTVDNEDKSIQSRSDRCRSRICDRIGPARTPLAGDAAPDRSDRSGRHRIPAANQHRSIW